MFERESVSALLAALPELERAFGGLPALPPPNASTEERARFAAVMTEVVARMGDNYPYFHPLYAGQMLKPPHPMARAAYSLATWINPNNHALDGGRASSRLEIEAVSELAQMFGWRQHLGHLTSGGTFANLEALWVAGQIAAASDREHKIVLASKEAHYTHERISRVLGLEFESIAADAAGRMDIEALEARLAQGGIATVVVTLGTTGRGAVDSLGEVLKLKEEYGFRVHVDAAYGGYFTLCETLDPDARAEFDAVGDGSEKNSPTGVDSLVIDPHKHGLQPYGCGCVLFRDPSVGRFYKHDSPYTYFTSDELHLGEISLECSRPGASAVALWATQRLLPLVPGLKFARGLEQGRAAAIELFGRLKSDPRFVTTRPPELDIVVWAVAAKTIAEASAYARRIFDAAATRDLHLAMIEMPASAFPQQTWTGSDSNPSAPEKTVRCLRSVLMKPEHLAWIDEIWSRLDESASQVLTQR